MGKLLCTAFKVVVLSKKGEVGAVRIDLVTMISSGPSHTQKVTLQGATHTG